MKCYLLLIYNIFESTPYFHFSHLNNEQILALRIEQDTSWKLFKYYKEFVWQKKNYANHTSPHLVCILTALMYNIFTKFYKIPLSAKNQN